MEMGERSFPVAFDYYLQVSTTFLAYDGASGDLSSRFCLSWSLPACGH